MNKQQIVGQYGYITIVLVYMVCKSNTGLCISIYVAVVLGTHWMLCERLRILFPGYLNIAMMVVPSQSDWFILIDSVLTFSVVVDAQRLPR